jgi:dipeptidyl aminopeptidase/acylaminoacyl peptidase
VPSQGGEPKLLFGDQVGGYVWTPKGDKLIIYGSKEPNRSVIAEIPAEGGEPRELMKLNGEIGSLNWSPDGRSLLYKYDLRPEKFSNSEEYLRERLSGINIISLEGGEPKALLPAEKKGVWYSHCKWSPDGKKIAFIVFDNARKGKEDMYSIWTMNADGGDRKLITNGGEYTLCWSPDGRYIVYESRIKGMDFEMYRVASEGGVPEKMNILGRSLEYSPDGKRIAYSRWFGGGYEFWLAENFLPKEKEGK